LILAITVSLVLMIVDQRDEILAPARQTISAAVHPVRLVADLPSEIGRFLSREFRSRRELLSEIERLKDQQLLNDARLQKLDSLEVENIRLRELLGSSYEVGQPVLIAELMKVDLDPTTHLIQIDKGAGDGVYSGQPVLDANGVIGQVDEVGAFTANVRLITDPSHAIPVQINRNGIRTVAMGTGDLHRLELSSLPKNTDIKVGDLLVTSGLGGRFPPGYPVARVSSIDTSPGRPFARVSAKPAGALDRIQEVLLVRGRDSDTPRIAGPDGHERAAPPGEPSS